MGMAIAEFTCKADMRFRSLIRTMMIPRSTTTARLAACTSNTNRWLTLPGQEEAGKPSTLYLKRQDFPMKIP